MWDDRAFVDLAAWRANFIAPKNSVFILEKGDEEKVQEFFSQRQVGPEAFFPVVSASFFMSDHSSRLLFLIASRPVKFHHLLISRGSSCQPVGGPFLHLNL